jgi:hypothetical protein
LELIHNSLEPAALVTFDHKMAVEHRALLNVWALRMPEYERVAQERWSTAPGDVLDSGITLFNGSGLSPEAELVEIFATIEEHHGEYSHTPALSEIEVFGAQPTSEVLAELNACGFDDISPSQRGFTARRDA